MPDNHGYLPCVRLAFRHLGTNALWPPFRRIRSECASGLSLHETLRYLQN